MEGLNTTLGRPAYRYELWAKDGQKQQIPIRNATETVEVTVEVLSQLLIEAGYSKVPEEEW